MPTTTPVHSSEPDEGLGKRLWHTIHDGYVLYIVIGMIVAGITYWAEFSQWVTGHAQGSAWLVGLLLLVRFVCLVLMTLAVLTALRVIKSEKLKPRPEDLMAEPPFEMFSMKFWWGIFQNRLVRLRHAVTHGYESHAPVLQMGLRAVFIFTVTILIMGDARTTPPFALPKADGSNVSAAAHGAKTTDVPAHDAGRIDQLLPGPTAVAGQGDTTEPQPPPWLAKAHHYAGTGGLRKFLGTAHLLLLGVYMLVTIICFWAYSTSAAKAGKAIHWAGPHEEVAMPSLCALGSWLDVPLITLLACTSLLNAGHFHMAYLIPLIGVWWGRTAHRPVVWMILLFTALRVIGCHYAPAFWAADKETIPGVLIVDPVTMLLTFMFWLMMCLGVMLVRGVRNVLSERVHRERFVHLALERLESEPEHFVFAKNTKRQFTYANQPLLDQLEEIIGARNREIKMEELASQQATGISTSSCKKRKKVGSSTQALVPVKKIFLGKHDHKPIGIDGRRLHLEDILERTDDELGIDCVEYFRSDAEVLGFKREHLADRSKHLKKDGEPLNIDDLDEEIGERDALFEDFEPTFTRKLNKPEAIWTRKIRLVDDYGEIVGLVGEAGDGQPEQLRRLAERLTDSLRVYALMKVVDHEHPDPAKQLSYVQWSSKSHLPQIEGRLKELARRQQLTSFLNSPDYTRELLLQKINKGRGPTDDNLYGELPPLKGDKDKHKEKRSPDMETHTHYGADDLAIVNVAKSVIEELGDKATEATVHSALFNKLKDWAATKRARPVQNYPTRGWVERHRFPDSTQDLWVEVRKWPWIEWQNEGARRIPDVRGVLVTFEDVTDGHIRRNVVWRWVRRHLKHAEKASSSYLRGHPGGVVGREASFTPLLELEIAMLGWFREMVDRPDEAHQLDLKPRSTDELRKIIRVLEHMDSRCKVEVRGLDTPMMINKGGRDLFAMILMLLINAGQSTIERIRQNPTLSDEETMTTLIFEDAGDDLIVTIKDQGMGFAKDDKARIKAGLCWGDGINDGWTEEMADLDKDKKVLMPGGGILLTKYLLRALLGKKRSEEILDEVFDIVPNVVPATGATARLQIPWAKLGGSGVISVSFSV